MKVYMVTYRKQNKLNDKWVDDEQTLNTFFIFANNQEEANEYMKSSLSKLNQYAQYMVRYVSDTEPKPIISMCVSQNIVKGTTFVNGLWE